MENPRRGIKAVREKHMTTNPAQQSTSRPPLGVKTRIADLLLAAACLSAGMPTQRTATYSESTQVMSSGSKLGSLHVSPELLAFAAAAVLVLIVICGKYLEIYILPQAGTAPARAVANRQSAQPTEVFGVGFSRARDPYGLRVLRLSPGEK